MRPVVICFHFSIFEVSETSDNLMLSLFWLLWFAFILVSLKYRKHQGGNLPSISTVVICFHFSIFEVSETSKSSCPISAGLVVICFHFSIFEVSETSRHCKIPSCLKLWFAFILVSLKYRKHRPAYKIGENYGCDLLSF